MGLLLFLFAVGLGLLAAIPVGACQIEVVKRAMAGHLRPSLMVAAGAAISDWIYGTVALFGIAPFLEVPAVLAAFSGAGAVILWALSYRTWRESQHPHAPDMQRSLSSHRWALATGFFLAISNPPLVFTWLLGIAVAKRIGLVPVLTHAAKLYFVAGGVLGLGGYLVLMSLATHRIRHFLSMQALRRVYRWLAVVLFVLSFYFVHGVAAYFMRAS
jgi:threonine/homoserine/homoserine lactone efflux protein